MKKYLLGSFAGVIAVMAVAFTTPSHSATPNAKFSSVYFQFNGTVGQEADRTKYTEITAANYSTANCPGVVNGCQIEVNSTFTTGTAGTRTITVAVPTQGSGTTLTPKIDGSVVFSTHDLN